MDEVGQRVVVERALADLAVEVDVLEHVLKRIDVRVFQCVERLVQLRTNVGLEVSDALVLPVFVSIAPPRFQRNEERVLVWVGELFSDGRIGHAAPLEVLGQLLALLIEEIAQPFQEEHAEDVFLVLRGIHVAAQIVAGAEQERGELTQRELRHCGEAITIRNYRNKLGVQPARAGEAIYDEIRRQPGWTGDNRATYSALDFLRNTFSAILRMSSSSVVGACGSARPRMISAWRCRATLP